jgi:quercetin dioxygenase-like cupin family protein
MKHILRTSIFALTLGSVAIFGAAPQVQAHDPHHTVVHADEVKWGAAPASLPPGAQASALLGSPAKEGPFVLRLKLPKGFVIPPHRHTKDEFVTVISGSFHLTAGEQVDRSAKGLKASSFVHLPAGMPHFAFTTEETWCRSTARARSTSSTSIPRTTRARSKAR